MSPTGPTSVTDLFRRQAARTPDAVAVESGSDRLSYAQLDAWSDDVARLLVERGVVRGERVAVCLERSPRLIAALLGVLKAAAAYLPIDVAEPERRLSDMMADAEPMLALSEPGAAERFAASGPPVVHVPPPAAAGADSASTDQHPPLPQAAPGDIAYLMYTSGSTGRPKAVVVEHRNITNLVTEPNYVELGARDRILQLAPVAFDAATFEIWGALLNGARLVLAPPGQVQAEELGELLRETGITVLWLTAALFHRQIDLDPEALAGLRTVLSGGDVLSVSHIRELRGEAPGLEIVNGYGPTETTTFACCHRIGPNEHLGGTVPIGRPLQNVVVQIVDPAGRPVPDGAAGELWIGGGGVSRGYWRRPELTAEKFVTGVGGALEGGRYYRSGDQARRRPDGAIEFLGRLDDQFKLRGFRIEPGEIENALTEHPQVRTAAVGIRESHVGDRRLVAWVVPTGDALDKQALREHLSERVPEHMIPAGFVSVAQLPITANGKTDRRALPDPDWQSKALYV